MGRNLVDVMPILVVAKSRMGIYTRAEWVDPGSIKDYNCIFSDLDMENAHGLFREMYGSVGSFLFIVKTAINSEQRVADEMYARLHGSGSMVALQGEIMSILHPPAMRGYVFVESSALHHVEKLIGVRVHGCVSPPRYQPQGANESKEEDVDTFARLQRGQRY